MDVLTVEQRRFNMSRIRGKDTSPELLIRKGLHARGFRFRLHDRKLPGRPDLVFPKYGAVIFVNGCFWHGHQCSLFKWPETRQQFWRDKIERTRERDHRAIGELCSSGWRVHTIWECMLRGTNRLTSSELVDRCADFLLCSES